MKKELEKNLQNSLSKFFKETNKFGEFGDFEDIQSLFEYLNIKMEIEGFKNQQFRSILKNTLIVFNKMEYFHNYTINYTINVIVAEESLKILGVTKNETKSYTEIIF